MKLVKAESTVKKQYLFTAIILLLVIIPVYLVSYNITMKNISAGIRGSVDVTMNMVDNEIENLRKTSLNITEIPEYVSVNKYMVVDSPVEYAEVKNFTEKYTQMIGLSNIIKDTFIVLKRSDIVVSKKLVLCGEDFYDIDNFIRFGDIGLNESQGCLKYGATALIRFTAVKRQTLLLFAFPRAESLTVTTNP